MSSWKTVQLQTLGSSLRHFFNKRPAFGSRQSSKRLASSLMPDEQSVERARRMRRAFAIGRTALNTAGAVAVASTAVVMLNPELRTDLALRLLPVGVAAGIAAGDEALKQPVNYVIGQAALPLAESVSLLSGREQAALSPAIRREQSLVADYIARRYRVADDAARLLVDVAYRAGREHALEPYLLLGVIAIESSFNPFAQSNMGAQGLMQVMTKVHSDKYEAFGGSRTALDPLVNIRVGTQVLKDCIKRGGSVEAGLRLYVGVGSDGETGYDGRVLAERNRIKDVASGRMTPMIAARSVNAMPKPVSPARTAAIEEANANWETVQDSSS